MKVAKSSLGPLSKIAEGGFGCVYRTPQFRLAGDPDEHAFKEFTKEHDKQARAARTAVDLWARLDEDERRTFGTYFMWPRALVHDAAGRVCGLLMPLLPDDFFTAGPNRVPRDLAWLVATQAQRAVANNAVGAIDLVDRHMILARLAYAFGLLHRFDWVYGDLSWKNVVFALDPPRVRIIDCDAAAPLADHGRVQANTPFWDPPELSTPGVLQDTRSDVYKLGLAILRCLTPGRGAATSSDPRRVRSELDPDGIALLRLALCSDPAVRPTAKDLYVHLKRLLHGRTEAPELHRATLLTPIRLRGQDVRIEWDVERAEEIVVQAANGQQVTAAPAQGGVAFRPDAAGPVTVTARNRFGDSVVDVGEVELFELPAFDLRDIRLPRPVVPELEPVGLARQGVVDSDRPHVLVGAPAVAPPGPAIAAMLERIPVEPRQTPPPPRLDAIVTEVAGGIGTSVRTSGTRFASVLHEAVAEAAATLTESRNHA